MLFYTSLDLFADSQYILSIINLIIFRAINLSSVIDLVHPLIVMLSDSNNLMTLFVYFISV